MRRSLVTTALLLILSLLGIFHLLILARIIPFELIWGGKLKSTSQMMQFEAISIVINTIMILVVAIKGGFIKTTIKPIIITFALWAMTILFLLNTIGNLLSENRFEKIVFAPMTLLLSALCFLLIRQKKD